MFDLNTAIKNWRAALAAQPGLRDSDLDELEDHLREETDALRQTGLSEEEAFLVACRRLGKPEDLGGEFAIADPERRRSFRLSWMIIGALSLLFLILAAEVVTNIGTGTLTRFPSLPVALHGPHGLGWIGGGLRLLVLVIGGVLIWRLLATDRSAHRLKRLGAGTVIFGALWLAGLALVMRVGSQVFYFGGFPEADIATISMIGAWFQLLTLLVLPVVLLVGLWRLVRS